jgi:predicted butyrate kinase (DUF1464 family)
LSKETIFSGGAVDIAGGGADQIAFDSWPNETRLRGGWLAWLEGAMKAALALTVVVSRPREILLSGRLGSLPGVEAALQDRLSAIAPVRRVGRLTSNGSPVRVKTAAQGAALLADGLAGGRAAPLVEAMQLRGASGSALDHLKVQGVDQIRIR